MTAFFDRRLRAHPVRFDRMAPALAGDLAYRRFCLPRYSTRRSPDHVRLADRARFHLRNASWVRVPTTEGDVQAYVFEPEGGRAHAGVLIAHGWTSEASFMAVFAEQLRRAGFRVVAFDQPAHGRSAQPRASLIDCARALLQVAEALGPLRFAVTHSMGGLAALLVGEGGIAWQARETALERDLAVPTAWLFGPAAHGLPTELAAAADHRVHIPMPGHSESLNIASAASICLYQSARAHRSARD